MTEMKKIAGVLLLILLVSRFNEVHSQYFLTKSEEDIDWSTSFDAYYDFELDQVMAFMSVIPPDETPCSDTYEFTLTKDSKGQYVFFMGDPGDYKNCILIQKIDHELEKPVGIKVLSTSQQVCVPTGNYTYQELGD